MWEFPVTPLDLPPFTTDLALGVLDQKHALAQLMASWCNGPCGYTVWQGVVLRLTACFKSINGEAAGDGRHQAMFSQ